MRCHLLALTSLLLVAAGCSRAHLPTLPASHGYLALAVDRQLSPGARPLENLEPADTEAREVTPAEAPTVFAEALHVLKGEPGEAQVRQAREDVSAACRARLQEACEYLRRESVAPRFLSSSTSLEGFQSQAPRLFTVIIHRCRITLEGKLEDCKHVEGGPAELAQARLRALLETRMAPVRFAGHSVEETYTFVSWHQPRDARLSHEQKVEWSRQRVRGYPGSVMAWKQLAEVLSAKVPLDPSYPEAVRQLNAMAPRYWWAASEQAWLHAEAGRYAEALPLAEQARVWAPGNPYVLELLAKVLAGSGRCEEALAEQRRAVEALPADWLDEERKRFEQVLGEYQQRCPPAG